MSDTSGVRHRVRSATPQDARALADLKVRAWRAAYSGLLPADLLAALDLDEEAAAWGDYLKAKPEDDRLWLAVEDEHILGFVRTEPGEVCGLYVDPERIGTGIGRALLEHAVADLRARGARRVAVWHFVRNERAARFYDIAGFVADGAIRASDFGVDEIRLSRPL